MVKSVSRSTVSLSFRQARICRDLGILLRLPLHSKPHSEKICSAYACESGTRVHPLQMVPVAAETESRQVAYITHLASRRFLSGIKWE